MTERPILFSGAMVRAILENSKTQTRRVIKLQPTKDCTHGAYYKGAEIIGHAFDDGEKPRICPFGKKGDFLWIRESFWAIHGGQFLHDTPEQRAATEQVNSKGYGIEYVANNPELSPDGWAKKPSIFMPRWASRLTLEITDIRVERLQEIDNDGARAEGFSEIIHVRKAAGSPLHPVMTKTTARMEFADLWDEINAKRGYSFEQNPFVWCISFKKVEQTNA